MSPRLTAAAAVLGAGVGVAAAGASGQVALRGVEAPPAGEVVKVDDAGVWLGSAGGDGSQPTTVIGWDRVREVQGARAGEADAFDQTADAAWRARARLERGDLVAAEPMFERLFESYRGKTGPTAAVIAEGLMRCRIRRAAHVAAVDPWLALLAARQGGTGRWLHPDWASQAGLGSVVDEATGLAPALPPIWLNWPSVAAWARSRPSPPGDARAAMLAQLYQASAQFEAGLNPPLPEVVVNDPGVQVVAEIVTARIGDEEQRRAARERLRERISPTGPGAAAPPAWLEAWCRAGIGRSLIRESDPDQRRLGVVELLHIPARFAATHPYLSGIALAEAAATMSDLGDAGGAALLANELRGLYPTHPVMDWGALRMSAPASLPPPAATPATVLPPEPAPQPGEQP